MSLYSNIIVFSIIINFLCAEDIHNHLSIINMDTTIQKNNYIICIPSYKRPKLLCDKTLLLLKEANIPSKYIYIFVTDENEYTEYTDIIPRVLYNKIIIGKKGITQQRNFIRYYFPEGTHIVCMDDDIQCLYTLNNNAKLVKSSHLLHTYIELGFKECIQHNMYLWGIYPVKNAFYMKQMISYDIKFILGTLYGFINRHNKDLILTLPEKEDYEMTIQHYLNDGGVVRLNHVTIKTIFHNKNGGLGSGDHRVQTNKTCASELKKRYPKFGYIWTRKNGMTEFRLYPAKKIEENHK